MGNIGKESIDAAFGCGECWFSPKKADDMILHPRHPTTFWGGGLGTFGFGGSNYLLRRCLDGAWMVAVGFFPKSDWPWKFLGIKICCFWWSMVCFVASSANWRSRKGQLVSTLPVIIFVSRMTSYAWNTLCRELSCAVLDSDSQSWNVYGVRPHFNLTSCFYWGLGTVKSYKTCWFGHICLIRLVHRACSEVIWCHVVLSSHFKQKKLALDSCWESQLIFFL